MLPNDLKSMNGVKFTDFSVSWFSKSLREANQYVWEFLILQITDSIGTTKADSPQHGWQMDF